MVRKMTPRAILAVVQRQDFPANWRVHRVMDRFDRSILLFPIIVFFVVPIGVILAEIYRPVDPVAPVLGFSLVAEIFAYLMWRYFLKARDAVIILLPHGLVLGNLRSGKPLFHLNYRRVAQMRSESTFIAGEGGGTHYALHFTLADGIERVWHCPARSEFNAQMITDEAVRDWQALGVSQQPDAVHG